jgi:hypothetical protein
LAPSIELDHEPIDLHSALQEFFQSIDKDIDFSQVSTGYTFGDSILQQLVIGPDRMDEYVSISKLKLNSLKMSPGKIA